MSDDLPNPNIVEAGKATQFGAENGPDPVEAGKKGGHTGGSIRASIRRLAAQDIDLTRNLTHTDIVKMFGRNQGKVSMAQALAAAKFQKALKGDVKAMAQLEDSVDGKLVEKRIEAEVTLADLVNGSYEHEQESESNQESSQ